MLAALTNCRETPLMLVALAGRVIEWKPQQCRLAARLGHAGTQHRCPLSVAIDEHTS